MNLSPKSRCQMKRQVNSRVSNKLVTPKRLSITTIQRKAGKSTGPLAKAFLSEGRSSESWPLGNESAARRLGDLRSLLAIQSQRLPELLLSSESHSARRKDQDKCQNHSDDKILSDNADGQLLQSDQSPAFSVGSEPVLANQLSNSGWELEVVSGVQSPLDSSGPQSPSMAALDKGDANSSGRPIRAFAKLLIEERESHQLVFSEKWSSQQEVNGNCEYPTFGDCHRRYYHEPVALFKSRSEQNVFEGFYE